MHEHKFNDNGRIHTNTQNSVSTPIQALVLDLGGVVFQLNWPRARKALGLDSSRGNELTMGAWPVYDLYERGQMSTAEFFEKLKNHFKLPADIPSLIQAWNQIISGPFPGIEKLLAAVPDTVSIFALSNTNLAHYEHITSVHSSCFQSFKHIYTSFHFGLRKPEPEIFAELVRTIQVDPKNILFIDDSSKNIAAAGQVGLRSELSVNSIETLEKILRTYSVLR